MISPKIRQPLIWNLDHSADWLSDPVAGPLMNDGSHSNMKRAQCELLCISAALNMTFDFIPLRYTMVTTLKQFFHMKP